MTSVAKREIKSMQAAGWTVATYGPWERLRALVDRRRPVSREVASEAAVTVRLHSPRPLRGWQ